VNRWNFSLNRRCYDPRKLGAYMSPNENLGELNVDTAIGFPLLHENRAIGKAVYGIHL
jgi:hypothetical protein